MTSQQRVLEAVAHRQADRIPIDFWAVPEVYTELQQRLGLKDKEALLQRFGVDLRYFNGPTLTRDLNEGLAEGFSRDHWGVLRQSQSVSGTRRNGTHWTWTYKHDVKSPLAEASSVREIEQHPWPKAELWDFSNVTSACQQLRAAGHAVVAGADRLDRTAQLKPAMYIRGTEQFMEDLIVNPAIAECILEHISAYYLEYNRRIFEAAAGHVDIFFMGDDMGTQASTWVSVEMYRRFFKKRFAAYNALAHRYGLKTMYHTCGNIASLVPEFIDAGLDILQSLQPRALEGELPRLKREYGKHLSFQGGIDIQEVLPNGSPEEVRAHVRQQAQLLGHGGGYIFGTAHNILPDTTPENILALIEAYYAYGRY